jgi:hypothetical protein
MTDSRFMFTDRARPIVEVGTGDTHGRGDTSLWDTARWDTPGDRWAGGEPVWVDISCDCYSYDCQYGRGSTIDRFVAGSATVSFDNSSGWADPTADPGDLSLRPGRQIRLGVEHVVLGTVWLWRGFIDAITPVYDPTDPDTVELSCIDALGEVNRAKTAPLPEALFAGDSASDRVNRLLDAAQWSVNKRDVSSAADTLIATDLGGQTADLLGQVADSVGGVVFADTTGTICFRPRDWQVYNPATPPDGTIGNGGTGARQNIVEDGDPVVYFGDPVVFAPVAGVGDDVCPARWERPFERADITTRVIMGRDEATAVTVDDDDGIVRYGIEPFQRTDLINTSDAAIAALARRILITRNAATAPRIRSVTLAATTTDASLDLQTTVDVFTPSRYRCRLTEARGVVFDDEYFATGVRHSVDPSTWDTLINLDLAAPYANRGNRWDTARWDQDTWTDLATRRALHA